MKISLLIIIFLLSNRINAQETILVTKSDLSHRSVYTDIIINASPTEVWEVLTDFDSYEKWSYMFKGMEGNFQDQSDVKVYFQLNPNKEKITEYNHIITVVDGVSFSWSDVFMLGMKDFHVFRVEEADHGKSRFIQTDQVNGGMTWLVGKQVTKLESKQYPLFNQALKREVEKRFPR